MENDILIWDAETKSVMTKSNLPVGGYSVNPYEGCIHGRRYYYAAFMKRFTGPHRALVDFSGCKTLAGDLKSPEIPGTAGGYRLGDRICTKSDLVVRDIDLLGEMGKVTASW